MTTRGTEQVDYGRLVNGFQRLVRRSVPRGATVIVLSKGDDKLLRLNGRRAWHFPQRADGEYAGHYPADSASAIAHLEGLRERGGEFFVIPSTALWWLEHYDDFRQHLENRYRLLVRKDGICRVYSLHDRGTEPAQPAGGGEAAIALEDYGDERLVADLRTVFDAAYYAEQACESFSTADEALLHYLETGFRAGLDPSPLFQTAYYLHRHPELAGGNPLVHFLRESLDHGQDPSPYFDTDYYYVQGPRLRSEGVNALVHYLTHGAAGQAYNPNPLFGNGYYRQTYDDVRKVGAAPFAHYLASGWGMGRFASRIHQQLAKDLNLSARSSLLRGNWKHGSALFFTRGDTGTDFPPVVELAELLATNYHIESIIVSLERSAFVGRVQRHAKLVVLEDYQTASDVLRPSALRLLTKALCSQDPLFAVSDVPEVLHTLDEHGVDSYFVFDHRHEGLPAETLNEVLDQATRSIFTSAEGFHSLASRTGRYPANVALRPTQKLASAADSDEDEDEAEAALEPLVELARRDFQLNGALTSPSSVKRLRGTVPNRIVIPCADWAVSGVNTSLEAVGRELQRHGWDVEIVFTRDPSMALQGGGEAYLPDIPYRFLHRKKPGVEGMWEALAAHLEDSAPCILFMSYDFLGNSVLPALTEAVGAVMWVQADDRDYYEQVYRLGRYCNAVVCVSHCIRERVAAMNPLIGERAEVIHNSSVGEAEIASRKRRSRSRMEVVYTGRLVQYQKRVFDFVDLAEALDATKVPYSISLIGTFAPREGVESAFRTRAAAHLEAGTIELLGRRSRVEILDRLRSSDFFVLLSDFEGLPLSLVEAMAQGCVPVVAEMESGIPEVVTPDENGLIVSGRDYEEWAGHIVDLWQDRSRFTRLSRNARQAVRDRFVAEQIGNQFDRLFRRVGEQIASGEYERPPALHWGEQRALAGDVLPPPSMYRPLGVAGLQERTPRAG